jgi:hypothetical protein
MRIDCESVSLFLIPFNHMSSFESDKTAASVGILSSCPHLVCLFVCLFVCFWFGLVFFDHIRIYKHFFISPNIQHTVC